MLEIVQASFEMYPSRIRLVGTSSFTCLAIVRSYNKIFFVWETRVAVSVLVCSNSNYILMDSQRGGKGRKYGFQRVMELIGCFAAMKWIRFVPVDCCFHSAFASYTRRKEWLISEKPSQLHLRMFYRLPLWEVDHRSLMAWLLLAQFLFLNVVSACAHFVQWDPGHLFLIGSPPKLACQSLKWKQSDGSFFGLPLSSNVTQWMSVQVSNYLSSNEFHSQKKHWKWIWLSDIYKTCRSPVLIGAAQTFLNNSSQMS